VYTFAYKPTIVGDRVTLRPMVAADAERLWTDSLEDESNRLTGTQGSFSRNQIDTWCETRSLTDDRLDLAVTNSVDGAWLGEIVVSDWDEQNRSCSFRVALTAGARNSGFGTEATQLIVDYVFDELKVNRIELEVYAFNPRALAVYRRVGFVEEGVRRQALIWDGAYVDAIVMSIIRADREF
jgi:RimJ/RimL family protein N-acetyltransferase